MKWHVLIATLMLLVTGLVWGTWQWRTRSVLFEARASLRASSAV